MPNILIHIIGGIGILIWILSVQNKDKSNILLYQGVANVFIALQFFLFKVYTPASMDAVTAVRSFIYQGYAKKDKPIPIFWLFVFLTITFFFAIFTWSGLLGLIPIINSTMYIITTWLKDTKWLRIFFVVAAMFWLYYNLTIGAYALVVGNIFEIITGVYSVIRFNKKQVIK